MSAVEAWVWLSSLENVSIRAKAAIIEHYGNAETAFFAPNEEYRSIPGLTQKDINGLELRDMDKVHRILDDCAAQNIRIITMQDADYPVRLKNIFAPPAALYVKGRLPDVDAVPAIAVIGTRGASPYGKKLAWNIAYEINRSGGIVISGLTEGIDIEAARASLMAGGPCIAVLGTAHGRESGIHRDIACVGAVVSEYAPGTESQKFFFRDRNRISSGLSHGVAVIEAPQRSGALLFAAEALEQGREVFAVPGNVDSANSVGTNMLIRQGAKAICRGWDVMEEYLTAYPTVVSRPGAQTVEPQTGATGAEKEKKANENPPKNDCAETGAAKKEIDKEKTSGYIDWQKKLEGLTHDQQLIIKTIGSSELVTDELVERSGLPTATVLAQLTMLEIKGLVCRGAGKRVKLRDFNSAKK